MAVTKAGKPADRDRLAAAVGGIWMAREDGAVPGDIDINGSYRS
jgi:glutamate N-acetyltransferase/amino-acid N-acetyltransferase